MCTRVHSTHARALHAYAVVEPRFVTEGKKTIEKNEFITLPFPSESPSNENIDDSPPV